jgi:prepilin-type N-terminal cleavage/methylation domain-containing protein
MKTQFSKLTKQVQRGFTLVEIAIVLVIIGLLIGGILRGQELITSARVRNLIDQKSAVQVAQIGFLDRYRMNPGDLTAAQATTVGAGAQVASQGPGGGTVEWQDGVIFFQNLSSSGFLACGTCNATTATVGVATADNSPVNVFGAPLWFFMWTGGNDGQIYLDAAATAANGAPTRSVLGTGQNVPSQVLAEVDRKADDGFPASGTLRFSRNTGQGFSGLLTLDNCIAPAVGTVAQTWITPSFGACAGGWIIQ